MCGRNLQVHHKVPAQGACDRLSLQDSCWGMQEEDVRAEFKLLLVRRDRQVLEECRSHRHHGLLLRQLQPAELERSDNEQLDTSSVLPVPSLHMLLLPSSPEQQQEARQLLVPLTLLLPHLSPPGWSCLTEGPAHVTNKTRTRQLTCTHPSRVPIHW